MHKLNFTACVYSILTYTCVVIYVCAFCEDSPVCLSLGGSSVSDSLPGKPLAVAKPRVEERRWESGLVILVLRGKWSVARSPYIANFKHVNTLVSCKEQIGCISIVLLGTNKSGTQGSSENSLRHFPALARALPLRSHWGSPKPLRSHNNKSSGGP